MPTQCRPVSFGFQGCGGRKVMAAFDGGSITSNAGALLLRGIDRSLGLFDRVAACFTDRRDPRLTEHSVHTLVAQRITGIALGYEDLNDHDFLRHDPLLALLSGKLGGGRKGCAALAGKSTLNRLEHAPGDGRPGRYHRIAHDPRGAPGAAHRTVHRVLAGTAAAVAARARHRRDGRQGARPPRGPLLPRLLRPPLLAAALRLLRLAPAVRRAPARQLRPRRGRGRRTRPHRRPAPPPVARAGDPGAGRLRLRPRGDHGLVRGQRRGLRHRRRPQRPARPENRAGTPRRPGSSRGGRGRPVRIYAEFAHSTRRSWSRSRRVIAKAEHLPGKANPRFVVTSLPGDPLPPDRLRARVLPKGQRRERHQGAAARSVRRPDLRHPFPPPTSSGSSSPPSPPSSSARCAARSAAPGWPAPPPARCA